MSDSPFSYGGGGTPPSGSVPISSLQPQTGPAVLARVPGTTGPLTMLAAAVNGQVLVRNVSGALDFRFLDATNFTTGGLSIGVLEGSPTSAPWVLISQPSSASSTVLEALTNGHVLHRNASGNLAFSTLPSISFANNTIAPARIAFSTTDRLLGRSTAGAGAGEEIVCTAAGRALIDDVSALQQRRTLQVDPLLQLSVVSATVTAQPGSPADGATYILPSGKSGAAWGPMAVGSLAFFNGVAWVEIPAQEGWIAFVRDTDQIRVFDGAAWLQRAARAALGLDKAGLTDAGNVWTVKQNFEQPLELRGGGETYTMRRQGADGYFEVVGSQVAPFNGFRYIGSGSTLFDVNSDGALAVAGALVPKVDNTVPCGFPTARWTVVYAITGTINTSDAREKTPLAPIPDAVKRAVRRVIAQVGVFQWLEAVERKGADGARLHIGPTAQAVRDAFLVEGLDPARWALFCEDVMTERVEIAPARTETRETVHPETGKVEVTEMSIPARFEERPKLDGYGEPVVRLGLRPDQLMMLALSVVFEEAEGRLFKPVEGVPAKFGAQKSVLNPLTWFRPD